MHCLFFNTISRQLYSLKSLKIIVIKKISYIGNLCSVFWPCVVLVQVCFVFFKLSKLKFQSYDFCFNLNKILYSFIYLRFFTRTGVKLLQMKYVNGIKCFGFRIKI